MTSLSAIRVIPFYGKSDEWSIWSDKFPAKAKRYRSKIFFVGKINYILKNDEVFDVDSEEGKKKMIIADLNELAYTELILSINKETSSGKVACNLVKDFKSKNYVNGNAFTEWKRLKTSLNLFLLHHKSR
jgi:hypothetical protein